MREKLLGIRKFQDGYVFYDIKDPKDMSQVFHTQDFGMELIAKYFYVYKWISIKEALKLIDKVCLAYLPITIKDRVEEQLAETFLTLKNIYDFREELKFLEVMLKGENLSELPKLKVYQGLVYVLGEDFISEGFCSNKSCLKTVKKFLTQEVINRLEYFKLKSLIKSSDLFTNLTLEISFPLIFMKPDKENIFLN